MTEPSTAVAGERVQYDGVHTFRILAALGVVFVHLSMSLPDGPSSVSPWIRLRDCSTEFFTAATFFLLTQGLLRNPDRSFLAFFTKRFMRIEVPFLVWTLLYWFVAGVLYPLHKGTTIKGLTWPLIACGYFHLYFLQFVFITSVCLFPFLAFLARRSSQPGNKFSTGITAVLFCMLGIGWASFDQLTNLSAAANAWAAAASHDAIVFVEGSIRLLGYVPLGIGFGLLGDRLGVWYKARGVRLGSVVLVATTAVIYLTAKPTPVLHWLYSAAVFAAVLQPWPAMVTGALRPAADASYSVYILHIFFMQALMSIQHRVGVQPVAAVVVLGGLLIFGFTLLVSMVLQRFAPIRWILPQVESPTRVSAARTESHPLTEEELLPSEATAMSVLAVPSANGQSGLQANPARASS